MPDDSIPEFSFLTTFCIGFILPMTFAFAWGCFLISTRIVECASISELQRRRRYLWIKSLCLWVFLVLLNGILEVMRGESAFGGLSAILFLVPLFACFSLGRSLRISRRICALDSTHPVDDATDSVDDQKPADKAASSWNNALSNWGKILVLVGVLGIGVALLRTLSHFKLIDIGRIFGPNTLVEAASWGALIFAIDFLLSTVMLIGGIGVCKRRSFGRIFVLLYCICGIARLPVILILNPNTGWAAGGSCIALLWYLILLATFARREWLSPLESLVARMR